VSRVLRPVRHTDRSFRRRLASLSISVGTVEGSGFDPTRCHQLPSFAYLGGADNNPRRSFVSTVHCSLFATSFVNSWRGTRILGAKKTNLWASYLCCIS